jgi:hypothetical protein
MKHYTPKQINEIKQQLRTGKPVAILADELAKEWKRPVGGVYTKVLRLSKQTRKITAEYKGPMRRPKVRKKKGLRPAIVEQQLMFEPMLGSVLDNFDKKMEKIVADIDANKVPVLKEICEEIIDKPIERQPAEIGIEVPVGVMAFTGVPSKIMVFSDHVRYYFDN